MRRSSRCPTRSGAPAPSLRQAPRTRHPRPARARAAPARTHCRGVRPKRSRLLSRARHPASNQGLGTDPRSARARRVDQQVPGRRQVERGQPLADAFGPGVVGRARTPARRRRAARPSSASASTPSPQPHSAVQGDQHGRRIGRAAAEAAAGRNALFDDDIGALADIRVPLAGAARRARRGRRSAATPGSDAPCAHALRRRRAAAGRMRVAPVEQPEHGLQRVVAVGAAAGDAQEQVELGRRRPGRPAVLAHHAGRRGPPGAWTGPHGAGVAAAPPPAGSCPAHASTTRRTRASPCRASRRRGKRGTRPPGRCPARRNRSPSRPVAARQAPGGVELHARRAGGLRAHAAHPVRQRGDRDRPSRSPRSSSAARPDPSRGPPSMPSSRAPSGAAAQAPALPGDRGAERHRVAPGRPAPVDAAAAALAAVGHGDAALPATSRTPAPSAASRVGLARLRRRLPAPAAPARAWRWTAQPDATSTAGQRRRARTCATARECGVMRRSSPARACSARLSGSILRASSKYRRASSRSAQHPQHLAQVGGDLGVLLQREGAAQLGQRLLVAAEPIEHPAVAVDDRGVVGLGGAGAVDQLQRLLVAVVRSASV